MTGKTYLLRCRLPAGQCTIDHLTDVDTVSDLKATLFSLTDIHPNRLLVMAGVPPMKLNLDADDQPLSQLIDHQRETLIVSENKEDTPRSSNSQRIQGSSTFSAEHFFEPVRRSSNPTYDQSTGFLLRKVVPANNSCLFTAVHFCLSNGNFDPSIGKRMRKVIADTVRSDPDFYNEGFLGKKNNEYIDWILNDDHWGGAIELFILSKHHKVEIVAVDTQNVRLNRFGEDKHYDNRIFLIYDGIHYDALFFEFYDQRDSPNIKNVITQFPCTSEKVLEMALDLAKEAKANRQFTDVQNFSLKCLVCNQGLKGQVQAQEHAKKTGHTNFGEI